MRRVFFLFSSLLLSLPLFASTRSLSWEELMKIEKIFAPTIAGDGEWVAWEERPGRGDGRAVVRRVDGSSQVVVDRGSEPRFSDDSEWVAVLTRPTLEEVERAEEDETPVQGMTLIRLVDGTRLDAERVRSFELVPGSGWLVYHRAAPPSEEGSEDEEKTPGGPPAAPAAEELASEEPVEGELPEEIRPQSSVPPIEELASEETPFERPEEARGTILVLHSLETGEDFEIQDVTEWAVSSHGRFVAYVVVGASPETDRLALRELDRPGEEVVVEASPARMFSQLTWTPRTAPMTSLAYSTGSLENEEEPHPDPIGAIRIWDLEGLATAAGSGAAPDGWFVPAINDLEWSRDGSRLFFGVKPLSERIDHEPAEVDDAGEEIEEPFEPYDLEAIREDVDLAVWHWDDPLIQTNQEKAWEDEKHRSYRAVWHRRDGRLVPLADLEVREISTLDGRGAVVGFGDTPYLQRITWDWWYRDLYRIDLESGDRQLIARELPSDSVSISPGGRWVLYWNHPDWMLFDGESGESRNLTNGVGAGFADEDHDYPIVPSGYGVAKWVGDEDSIDSVLIYDKYDVWQFPMSRRGRPIRLTDGRDDETIFRIVDLLSIGSGARAGEGGSESVAERLMLRPGERILLEGYSDRRKNDGFWSGQVGRTGVTALLEGPKRYQVLDASFDRDALLLTRESYSEFPDLWVAGPRLDRLMRISNVNPEIAEFGWGESTLVEWTGPDGKRSQGVLILPGDYEPGNRYPVLVYFYRFMSHRLHLFNEPVINHRPSFPMYASNGYAIFLPDIRFEIGHPGRSALESLEAGVEKIVDLGVADPERVGLHGHSWSGYQAAWVVTQTDTFAAAVAGAPVSNMTSAYGGIRYGSGRSRAFQYEKSQSRIGKSPWEEGGLDLYIENSPVFFADQIETPLLIQFGDVDEAVPWTQGIELYIAMRRLRKPVWFLQYREEPHHLQKFANKLDYSIRMLEFFDHYLKDAAAPEWMTEGVPYRGD